MAPKRPDTSKFLERNSFTALPFEARFDPLFLDVLECHYKRTNNPLYVWQALRQAYELDLAVPAWVRSYLHKTADQLLEIPGDLGKKTLAAIADALNIKTIGGGSQFKRFKKEERNIRIYMRVHDMREKKQAGMNKKIYELVAEEFNLKPNTVRAIVKKYSTLLKVID